MWNAPGPGGGGSEHQYQQHQQSSSSFSATAASFSYTHDPLPELHALIRAYYTSHQCRCVFPCLYVLRDHTSHTCPLTFPINTTTTPPSKSTQRPRPSAPQRGHPPAADPLLLRRLHPGPRPQRAGPRPWQPDPVDHAGTSVSAFGISPIGLCVCVSTHQPTRTLYQPINKCPGGAGLGQVDARAGAGGRARRAGQQGGGLLHRHLLADAGRALPVEVSVGSFGRCVCAYRTPCLN